MYYYFSFLRVTIKPATKIITNPIIFTITLPIIPMLSIVNANKKDPNIINTIAKNHLKLLNPP